jgi:P27 family predicted phage terminase small subunit
VSKAGEVVGYKAKRHPATTISKDALASMLRAASLFGFDPSSRSRLSIGEGPKEDDFAVFMKSIHPDESESS